MDASRSSLNLPSRPSETARKMPVDVLPEFAPPSVQIQTEALGLSAIEVEQFITFPVETVMSGVPRVAEVRSVSRFGLSAVTIVFDEGTDIYWARQQVGDGRIEPEPAKTAGILRVRQQGRHLVDGQVTANGSAVPALESEK